MEQERLKEAQTNRTIWSKRHVMVVLPIAGALMLLVGLLLGTGVVASPLRLSGGLADESVAAGTVPTSIFYQGRIIDAGGDPITGTHVMTFSLYTQISGGAPLAQDSHSVDVVNGLFRTYMTFPATHYDGQALFVGVQVEGDTEMTPRHYLRPVPYALSLRPGATISGDVAAGQPALRVVNTGTGNAIRGYKDGAGAAVAGVNDGAGPGGYFSSPGDYALYVDGDLFVNGSVWSRSYENVIVVAKGRGGDYSSIQSALDSITDAAEDNPYLVRVMPGVYEEQVTLKPYVTVQGSGWRLTVISYTAATVVEGADNATLSNLHVIHNSAAWTGKAINLSSVDNMSIEGVVVQTRANNTSHGIYITNSSTEIRNCVISAGEADRNYGVYAQASSVDISDSLISASGGSAFNEDVYGIHSTNLSVMTIQGSTVRASGWITSAHVHGICNSGSGSELTASNTTIEVYGLHSPDSGGVQEVVGFENLTHAPATLEDCTIRATGAVTSTDWVIGVRNKHSGELVIRRSVIDASGARLYTNGIYGIDHAETRLWFSEVYADSTDGIVRAIHSYQAAPFELNYSTVSATGGGALAGQYAYGLFTDIGTFTDTTEILIREGMISSEDYAIYNSQTYHTIKVFETWLAGTVNTTTTYICLGAHDGTAYLGADCQPGP